MAKKRWYALRSIKLNECTIAPGKFLTSKEEKQIHKDVLPALVRNCRLYDTEGEIDTKWSDRGIHRLRLRCLHEIGDADSDKIAKMIAERNASKRLGRFSSNREKEIANQIAKTTKNPDDIVVEKPKKPKKTKKQEAKKDLVEDLFGEE